MAIRRHHAGFIATERMLGSKARRTGAVVRQCFRELKLLFYWLAVPGCVPRAESLWTTQPSERGCDVGVSIDEAAVVVAL